IKWPDSVYTDIPKSLQAIIKKALEKEQCMRYQSAQEMIDDLKRSLIEPDGDFVVTNISSDMPTQTIPSIGVQNTGTNGAEGNAEVKDTNKKKILFSIIPMALILVFLIFMGISIYRNNFMIKEVEVPDIEGLSLDEASGILRDKQLSLDIIGDRHSTDIEEGHIISQQPAIGTSVEILSSVKVIVSLGPKTIK